MIRHLLASSAVCAVLALPVAVAAPPAAAARPAPAAAAPVNLLGNPTFEAAVPEPPFGWNCTAGMATGEDLPGSEFIQFMPLDGPEVPVLTGAPPAAKAVPAAKVATAVGGPTVVATTRAGSGIWLEGTPTASDAAGCTQVVPVRRGATYTLSVMVLGGPAVLGTEYGEVSAPEGVSWTRLSTTFTVAPRADLVRVHFHGRVGGAQYLATNPALVGPPSDTRGPAVPTGLAYQRRTSRWIQLQWTAAAGAGRYEVRLDGAPVGMVDGTAALVLGLNPGQSYAVTVVALNGARPSAPSAAVTMSTARAFTAPPGVPEWNTVDVWSNGDGAWFANLDFWRPDGATDGYFVYLDGVRTGWLFDTPAQVPVPPGTHTLQLSAVNSMGESVLSEPFEVVAG